jgi:hypothetical protein
MDPHIILSIFHILFVAPLFLFVGFMRASTPIWLYWLLVGLGLMILVYHGYKAFIRWRAASSYLWVNLLHVALVAPLLLFVGAGQKDTPRYGYELMAMTGFAVAGYHLYSLVKEIQVMDRG